MESTVLPCVAGLRLVDHHCHGVVDGDLGREEFESLLTEADAPAPGTTLFDSLAGLAVRRWCAPLLGLPAHASPGDYLARRAELGAETVNGMFLRAAGLADLCVDTGFAAGRLLSPARMGEVAGARAHEIVRLEQVAEEVAAEGPSAGEFADAVRARLAERAAHAAGVKSIAAYRAGLALPPRRPTGAEVRAAAGRWLSSAGARPRLADMTLHAYLAWCGVDLGLPVQFHVGYGDADVDLHRCDPLLLTGWLRATAAVGTPVVLLHNYPYHRGAAYLAQVFPHVYLDAGLATHNAGHRAAAVIAETLELAPFGKFLFSSDGFGLPELHYLGALWFRRGLDAFLRSGLDAGEWTYDDAARIAHLTGAGNARRVYRLDQG
ncbi:amidohydrolase family protein [Sphaerisporangium aureirubrum]|uniref:Amidohydrolase family protein n=1 Tax=Sphaerisporangium aureirubrum TaxID=1544736 RepID=A0ABW1NBU7_9ACTN